MTSPRRAELRRGARTAAKRADALRALENPLVVQRDFLQAMQRLPYASDSALAAKLPTWLPLVQRTIKNWVRNTGIVEIAEAVLRDHPGKPSKITTDKLLTAMMLASWKNLTYKRVDLLAALAELPDEILKAYGMFDENGVALPKSPAFDKQLRRFEKMIRNGKDPVTGAGLDQTDVEDRAVTASLPPRINPTVISLDNTPFESWFLSKIHIKESEARERTEQRYREVCDPDAAEPTPEMGSELMRELARQIGIPIGPDGRWSAASCRPRTASATRTAQANAPKDCSWDTRQLSRP